VEVQEVSKAAAAPEAARAVGVKVGATVEEADGEEAATAEVGSVVGVAIKDLVMMEAIQEVEVRVALAAMGGKWEG